MANYEIFNSDCCDWLHSRAANSIHAVCTDPPYGLIEFSTMEITKLRNGNKGGIWRVPPSIGGAKRDPLPRFTVLTHKQKAALREYFQEFGEVLLPVLVPGAYVCIAGHPMLQYLVQGGMAEAGFEVRPAILRLYGSFRGGDRPKGAEKEYPEVCVTPRSAYEPWMLFRKPISEKTIALNLKRWGTGGLRRLSSEKPLPEGIQSIRTPELEAKISNHPCLKPQQFMRVIVRSLLPLGKGIILDPFMGSGSTIAAAEVVGYSSIGVEIDKRYYEDALNGIPLLANLYQDFKGDNLDWPPRGTLRRFKTKALEGSAEGKIVQVTLPL